ncbi:MAG: hypothetical protein ACRCX8_16450 [Sarcina sp.]
MGLYPNFPSFSYIGADGISVVWNKEVYMVQAFNTNKKYIYWTSSLPNQLNASNTMPNRSASQYLVLINDNGIITEVPSTSDDFAIFYDGNSSESIKERIYGLYEKNDEFGNRFVTVEQNIEGIKQMVGEDGQEGNTLWGKVSEIEQKADEIDLSVKNFEKKYNDDKETDELRENLNSSIISLNADLGTFKSEISDYIKDNQIDSEEKVKIETQILILLNSKANVETYVDKVILIAKDNNLGQDVVALESAKLGLQQAHENLDKFISVSISDGVVTPSEKSVIIDAFAKYSLRINELKNTCDNVMLLGMGGIISEELAKISIKSDEIMLSVSRVESTFKSDSSIAKIEMSKQVEDIIVACTNFESTVNTSFENNECDATELQLIEEKIVALNKEKLDLDSIYELNLANKDISDTVYEQLEDIYKIYNNKHDEVINYIRQSTNDSIINDAEKLKVSALFKEYFNTLANAEDMLKRAIDNIAFNKANAEIREAKDNMQKQIDDVKNSVSSVGSIIDSTFDDNAVDEIERENISNNLSGLGTTKGNIDNVYNAIYSNEFLVGNYKANLKNSYDNYVLKYNDVINIVDGIVNKEGLIDDIDRANMNSSIERHNEFLGLLEIDMIKAINSIKRQYVISEGNRLLNYVNNVKDYILEFKTKFDEFFKVKEVVPANNSGEIIYDYILDDEEKSVLSNMVTELTNRFNVVKNTYDTVISNDLVVGDIRISFIEKYTECKTIYDKFVLDVNGLISKDVILEEDVIDIDNVYFDITSFFNAFIDAYKVCVDAIITSDIENSISSIKGIVKEMYKAIDLLRNTMSGVFKDCMLNESEKLSINQSLKNLSSEKADIDKQYATLYSNVDLTGEDKVSFKARYDNYVLSYNALVVAINNVLEKTSLINDSDRNGMNNAFKDHDVKLGLYIEGANKAVDVIAQNKAKQESEKVDKKYATIILDPETGISSKVEHLNTQVNGDGGIDQRLQSAEQKITSEGISTIVQNSQFGKDVTTGVETNKQDISKVDQKADSISSTVTSLGTGLSAAESKIEQNANNINLSVKKDGVISSINASAEGIKINANKITLTGYVTMTDLSNAGSTTINGSNITTGTINASYARIINIDADNITTGTLSGNRIYGGLIEGATLRTPASTSNGGIWIKDNSMQVGETSIFYSGSLRLEANSRNIVLSGSQLHIMTSLTSVGGVMECTRLKVNGIEITAGGQAAVFG